jgi:carboxymethylenebutenolidase
VTQEEMTRVWEEHVAQEFAAHDVEGTMATMTEDPYLDHVPVMAGGTGREEVRSFYGTQFIPSLPADVSLTPVSRTVGQDQIVDELILSFTHTTALPWMLPGVPPTGRRVEVPVVVIAHFRDDKIAHEHIYWDQGSVLKQTGLITDPDVPAFGAETAQRLRDLTAGKGH